jgi:hypothetical protein
MDFEKKPAFLVKKGRLLVNEQVFKSLYPTF